MAKVVYPYDAGIQRFYRGYISVDEETPEDKVREAIVRDILEHQDGAYFDLDPTMKIERDDITGISIDWDGIMDDLDDCEEDKTE